MMAGSSQLVHAEALLNAGSVEQARAVLQRVLRTSPGDVEANRLMSIALSTLGQLEQALFFADRAVAGRRDDPALVTAAGNLLFNLGRLGEAMARFRTAIEVDPAYADAHEAIADLHYQSGRLVEAEGQCREGLRHNPDHRVLSTTLAAMLLNTGRAGECRELLKQVADRWPLDPAAAGALSQASLYVEGMTPEQILEEHRRFAAVLDRVLPERINATVRQPDPERALRIGFVSPDFRRHSVAFFLEPLLECIDRDRFQVVCYHTAVVEDEVTRRFQSRSALWRQVAALPIQDLAHRIADDGIDILVDVAGHTDGARLAVFHMRPAPIQVSYLGYASTTGLAAMDYRIVDNVTDPAGSERFSSESLFRLDPCFVCYQPPTNAPHVKPRDSGVPLTFGSFNALQKINDPLLVMWGRVLDAVPGSRLLLKSGGLTQQPVRDAVLARLQRLGVDCGRIELLPWVSTAAAHLESYAQVDIALDTFPYCGTTTTCDSLLMGVPVVTLAGEHHAARVGASLLSAIGLEDLIARSPDEFVRIASALASDRGRLFTLRGSLRDRLMTSPLCDVAAYAVRFQDAMRSAWRDACRRAGKL